jgi:hypothetical protein
VWEDILYDQSGRFITGGLLIQQEQGGINGSGKVFFRVCNV